MFVKVKFLFFIFFFVNCSWAQDNITKVIDLHYMNASTVIPLLQPLLQKDEQITGTNQTLIVNVMPDTLSNIRLILHRLDVPPVTFEVSVYQGSPDWLNSQNENTITISTSSHSQQRQRQSVKVLNGEAAFIATGEDIPLVSSVGIGFWTGVSYERQKVQNGLLVSPVLQGHKVRLSIRRVREQEPVQNGQRIDQQNIDTTLMVPLNQWVSLGSPQGDEPADQFTTVIRAGNQFTDNSTLYVRVRIVQKFSSGIQKD